MTNFNIQEYVEFNAQGRAICPSCVQSKGAKHRKLNLSLHPSGAYHCFAGCQSEDIRAALGVHDRIIPTALATVPSPAARTNVTVSPQKVKEANARLAASNGPAKEWLHERGITDDMIARHQLGIVRAKAGNRFLPAISIPIPAEDGTAYYQKKRVAPWLREEELPEEYKPWSQFLIPPKVWFSYLPVEATSTWLCEGEWDAILLGWAVRQAELPVAVASFTCGCGNVPPQDELDLLPGQVIIFYDRNDTPIKQTGVVPADEGARKAAAALGDRARIGLVPMTDGCDIPGWDVSNAIQVGFKVQDFEQAAAAATRAIAPAGEASGKKPNSLRSRLVTNAQLMAMAPDYVEWLVPDLLPANELIMLAAGPRMGKSLLSMGLAKAVATGESFLDRPVTQGPVIYVRCEDAPVKIKQRQIAQGWPDNIPIYWLDRFKLAETRELRELAEELDARLIILDTLSRIRDDNTSESSAEMSRVLEPLQELAEDLNCSIVLVHHTGKVSVENANAIDIFDTIRGSTAIRATCRGSMVIAADSDCFRLCAENGYGKVDLKIRLDSTTLEWKLLGRWTTTISSDQRTAVEEYINKVGQATLDQIFEDTQIPKASLYVVLSRLARENYLIKSGNRRQVLYTRSPNLIKQLDDLLDDAIAHPDDVRGTYLTKNISSLLGDQGDQSGESDHSTHANHDHSGENDHSTRGVTKTPNLLDNPSNIDGARVSPSNKSSNKPDLLDESGEIRPGDRVVYRGKSASLERVCGLKKLEVVRINGDQAEVSHKQWLVTQTIPLIDLRRAKP